MIVALLLFLTLMVQAAPSITPTPPEPPRDSSDLLLRMVIADILRLGHRELKDGPILIERTDQAISPRILPDDSNVTFALLPPSDIGSPNLRGRYYLNLKIARHAPNEADVTVFMGPAGVEIALCCFTVVRRYEQTDGTWRFIRTVSSAIH